MTRVLTEEFEGTLPGQFSSTTGTIALSTNQAFTGTKSARCNPSAATGYATEIVYGGGGGEFAAYIRVYLFIATAPSASCNFISCGDGTFFGAHLRVETNRTLRMYNDTVAIGVASSAIPLNEWHCVEFYYDDRNSGGDLGNNWEAFRLDGTLISSVAAGDMAGWDQCRIGVVTSTTADFYIDVAAINDQNGAVDKSWPGLAGPAPDPSPAAIWVPGFMRGGTWPTFLVGASQVSSRSFQLNDVGEVASGEAFTQTPTDDLSLTDSIIIELVKGVSDDLELTDERAISLDKVTTDNLGLVDTVALGLDRPVTDDLGLTDTVIVEKVLPVNVTDTEGLTDAVVLDQGKGVLDSLGLTDATATDLSKSIVDSFGLTDAAALSITKPVTDNLGLTDTVVVDKGLALASTDNEDLTDTVAVTVGKGASDNLGLTDIVEKIIGKAPVDNLGLTDAITVDKFTAISSTDNMGLTDSISLALSKVLTDAIDITDSPTVQLAGSGEVNVNDTEALTDTSVMDLSKTIGDDLGLTDARALALGKDVTDNMGMTDSVSIVITRGVSDNMGLTDIVTTNQGFVRVVADNLAR